MSEKMTQKTVMALLSSAMFQKPFCAYSDMTRFLMNLDEARSR